jgi:hypothetical protein
MSWPGGKRAVRQHHHLFRCACRHFAGQHGLAPGGDLPDGPWPCTLCDCTNLHDEVCQGCGQRPNRPLLPRWASDVGAARNVAGRTYLEQGRPVTVLCGWGPGGGPRNVRIRREDGTTTIRPFRGLRRVR